ncbi:MAG: glycosyltransferase family 4 protein [Bacteroidales bacterium]|nr:glycosyltransferase family 4 protein [Bacteroidales bacterium]
MITVSRLIAQKNIDIVIRAFAELRKQYNISFTVVGGGPEMENLVKLKDDLNLTDVHFTDAMPHEDIPEFIKISIFSFWQVQMRLLDVFISKQWLPGYL